MEEGRGDIRWSGGDREMGEGGCSEDIVLESWKKRGEGKRKDGKLGLCDMR